MGREVVSRYKEIKFVLESKTHRGLRVWGLVRVIQRGMSGNESKQVNVALTPIRLRVKEKIVP